MYFDEMIREEMKTGEFSKWKYRRDNRENQENTLNSLEGRDGLQGSIQIRPTQ